LYCRIQALAIADPMFHAERFGKVPIKLLQAMLEQASTEQQRLINAHSMSTAKLAVTVVRALGGKTAQAKVDDFLPFEQAKPNAISSETKEALQWALKTHRLPPVIVGLIGAELAR
jgi:hypothetical protein